MNKSNDINKKKSQGIKFEEEIYSIIDKLNSIGLAKNLKRQDHVIDRDGNIRKIDITFILCTDLIEIMVTAECKSRKKKLSLSDIDQIKTYKSDLSERNIFWLIYEGDINKNVEKALKINGISYYSKKELENLINDIIFNYNSASNEIHAWRMKFFRFSMMDTYAMTMAQCKIHEIQVNCFISLNEVSGLFNILYQDYLSSSIWLR